MRKQTTSFGRFAVTAAALAALSTQGVYAGTTAQPAGTSIPGNTNGNDYATISLSGSTALRNYTKSTGVTFLPNGATIFLSSGTYTASTSGAADQLAPSNSNDTGDNTSSVVDVPALRVEWHEQGSVEGILELATDQIATPAGLDSGLDQPDHRQQRQQQHQRREQRFELGLRCYRYLDRTKPDPDGDLGRETHSGVLHGRYRVLSGDARHTRLRQG